MAYVPDQAGQKAFQAKAEAEVARRITRACAVTTAAAKKNLSGVGSGRIYAQKHGKKTMSHRASAPGEYPVTWSGRLRADVHFVITRIGNQLHGIIGTNNNYAAVLEFGGRPWLRRTVLEMQTTIRKIMMGGKI
jgi:phage gpG-like protein